MVAVKAKFNLWITTENQKNIYGNFHDKKIPLRESRGDLSKYIYTAYHHTSISMSFINKYFFDKQETNKQPGLGIK